MQNQKYFAFSLCQKYKVSKNSVRFNIDVSGIAKRDSYRTAISII